MNKKQKTFKVGDLVFLDKHNVPHNDEERHFDVWEVIEFIGNFNYANCYRVRALANHNLIKLVEDFNMRFFTTLNTSIKKADKGGLSNYGGCTSCFSNKFDYNTFNLKPKFKIGEKVILKESSTFHSVKNLKAQSSFGVDKIIVIDNILCDYKNKRINYYFKDSTIRKSWNKYNKGRKDIGIDFYVDEKNLKKCADVDIVKALNPNILDKTEIKFLNNILCILYQLGKKNIIISKYKNDNLDKEYLKFTFTDITNEKRLESVDLPAFKRNYMYRGMKLNEIYEVEDLGLNKSIIDFVK